MSPETTRLPLLDRALSTAETAALATLLPGPLICVLGKGGVGKSTIAAALGLALAESGRRTLLLEIDARESLHEQLGVAPSGGAVERVHERLALESLRPRTLIDRQVESRIPVGFLARHLLAHPVYQHFADGAPGLKENAALHHAAEMAAANARDPAAGAQTIVIDAPATGHGLALLAAPRLMAAVIPHGPFGEIARELAGWVADPARCQLVVVTQAEEMPVEETLELRAALASQLGAAPRLLVVNALTPLDADLEPPDDREAAATESPLALWRKRCALHRRQLGRLREAWPGPRVELPLLPRERGPGLARALALGLVEGLAGSGGGEP